MGNNARIFLQMHFQPLRKDSWIVHKLNVTETLYSFISHFGVHVNVKYHIWNNSIGCQFFCLVSSFREIFKQESIFDTIAELNSLSHHFNHKIFRNSSTSFDLLSKLLSKQSIRLNKQWDNVFDSKMNHSSLAADSLTNC